METELKNKAFEIGKRIISEAMKTGKDTIVQFQDFLDWLIETFSLESLLKNKCNYEKLFDSIKDSNVFYECLTVWVNTVNESLKRHECIDFFGEVYETMFQTNAKAQRNQQYFTPDYIFDFIARIQLDGTNKYQYKYCSEPSCGSGRGLLKIWQKADWKDKYFFYAEDLDPVSVKMCALNMMINGMFGLVICHNTLFPEDFILGYAVNEVRHPYPCNYYSIRPITKDEFLKKTKVVIHNKLHRNNN